MVLLEFLNNTCDGIGFLCQIPRQATQEQIIVRRELLRDDDACQENRSFYIIYPWSDFCNRKSTFFPQMPDEDTGKMTAEEVHGNVFCRIWLPLPLGVYVQTDIGMDELVVNRK